MIWVFEFLYGSFFFAAGLFFLNLCVPKVSVGLKAGMAFPAGFALYALYTLLLLSLKIPISLFSIAIGFIIFLAVIVLASRHRKVAVSRNLMVGLLAGVLVIGAIALLSSHFKYFILTYDSYTYAVLSGNVILTQEGLTGSTVSGFITSYAAMVPFGNSAAGLWGRDFVSISPALFSASIMAIIYASIISFMSQTLLRNIFKHGIAAACAILVITTPQFWFHSFYVMPNLPMAAFVLCVIAGYWAFLREEDAGWYIPLGLFLIAVGMCRLEGGLFVIFTALGFTAVTVKNPWKRTAFYMVVCVFLSVWLLYLSSLNPGSEGGILSTNAAIAQSLLLMTPVIAAGLSVHAFMRQLIRIGVIAMPVALILAGAFLFATDMEHGKANLLHWTLNVTSGIGLWGWSWMGLAVIFSACAVIGRPIKGSYFIACIMISLFVLVFNLGLFREFPYRLGAQDSGNRLMLQIFPSFVLAAGLWIANSLSSDDSIPSQAP